MEQETLLNEIMNALNAHGKKVDHALELMRTEMKEGFKRVNERFEQIDRRFERVDERFEQIDRRFEQVDERFEQIDKRFEQVDERFDRLEKKFDGSRADFHDIQENVNYLLSRNAKHEKQLQQLSKQQ